MKLEKCYQPGCGGEMKHYKLNGDTGLHYLQCENCGYCGPNMDTEPQAIAAHNRGFYAIELAMSFAKLTEMVMYSADPIEAADAYKTQAKKAQELDRLFRSADKAARGE